MVGVALDHMQRQIRKLCKAIHLALSRLPGANISAAKCADALPSRQNKRVTGVEAQVWRTNDARVLCKTVILETIGDDHW